MLRIRSGTCREILFALAPASYQPSEKAEGAGPLLVAKYADASARGRVNASPRRGCFRIPGRSRLGGFLNRLFRTARGEGGYSSFEKREARSGDNLF